jgi:methionyl-tRNA formyltransferase
MNEKLKIIMITGNKRRHYYAASMLFQKLDLIGIVSEAKLPILSDSDKISPDDRKIVQQHMTEMNETEKRYLGPINKFPETEVLALERGASNTPGTLEWIRRRNPDFIVLYGSSIIKPPLLEEYDQKIINLHLGLSPYYRGSGTNFWPLVYKEPECVGATIHLAVQKVDAGAILAQVRPGPEKNDRAHDLGVKTIMAGFLSMPDIIKRYSEGDLHPQTQDLTQGRVFKRKDFCADAVNKMWNNFNNNMMEEYILNMKDRQKLFPIIDHNL